MPEGGYPYGVQYDEQGRPFLWMRGKKNYLSPVAFGQQAPADTTGPFRSRPQWNQSTGQWETPIDWGNILNVGVGSALGLGALHAAGVIGGGAAGAAPGTLGPSTPANIAATASAATAVPAALAATSGGGARGIGNKILQGLLNPKTLAALGIGAGSLIAGNTIGGDGGDGGSEFLTPEMRRYQALSEARFRRTDPLHAAIAQLAFQRLPLHAREGLPLPRVPLPEG